MAEVGSIIFNPNPMSATKVEPPRRWPRQPKTTPAEELKEVLDAFPKTIVMDGCTEMIDEIDEAVQRHINKKRCTTREKVAEKEYSEMMETLKPHQPKEDVLDRQVGGSHYKQYKIQPYEFFLVNQIPHHKAAVIRRILRYDHPTGKGLEDLKKIQHEIELIIQLENWGDAG